MVTNYVQFVSAVLRNTVSTEPDKSIQHGGSEWPSCCRPSIILLHNYFHLLASFNIIPSVYRWLDGLVMFVS